MLVAIAAAATGAGLSIWTNLGWQGVAAVAAFVAVAALAGFRRRDRPDRR